MLPQALEAAVRQGASLIIDRSESMRNATLFIPAGIKVECAPGVVLEWTEHVNGVVFEGSATMRTHWTGGKLLGPGGRAYKVSGNAMTCSGRNRAPEAPAYVLGPWIEDVQIEGWGAYGFFGAYLDGGHFRSSKGVRRCGYAGVAGVSCNDFRVESNVIDDIGPGSPGGDAYGIFIDRHDGRSEQEEPRSRRCVIAFNSVSRVAASGGNGQGIDTHAGTDFQIHDNTVEACQVGIFVTSSAISGVATLGPKRVTVARNSVKGSRLGYGILVTGATDGVSVRDFAEDCSLAGNVVEGMGRAGDSLSAGILCRATRRLRVEDCTIVRCGPVGFDMVANNFDFIVRGLAVVDPHDNVVNVPACVRFSGSNNVGRLSGVSCSVEDATLAKYVAVHSLRIGAQLQGLDIDVEPFSLKGKDGTRLEYSEATSRGVRAEGMKPPVTR